MIKSLPRDTHDLAVQQLLKNWFLLPFTIHITELEQIPVRFVLCPEQSHAGFEISHYAGRFSGYFHVKDVGIFFATYDELAIQMISNKASQQTLDALGI